MIDGHTHIEPELAVEGLVRAMDEAGVRRAVLMAAAQVPIGPIPRAGPALMHACCRIPALRMPVYRTARARLHQHVRPDNELVYAAARAHPGRFLPFVFVNATLGEEAHEELERGLEAGARGVKLHLWFHRYRLPDAMPILRRCEERGLPVLAHLGFGPPEDVAIVLHALPRLKLVLAHAGIPHFERLWRLKRVRFDTAAVPALISRGMVRRLLGAVGPDRVVFGSDAPIGIRARGGYRYDPPPLPERALGPNLEALLG